MSNNSFEELYSHESEESSDQYCSVGLAKTKSYQNWKKENVINSIILKDNSYLYK